MIKIDAEFHSLIPPLADEERMQLEANLKAEGCRDPLVTWGGILLDGHNRKDICERNGIPFKTHEIELAGRDDAKIWIVRNQFGRRNLPPFPRCELAKILEQLIAKKAKVNQSQSMGAGVKGLANLPNLSPINTREEVARSAGVSERTYAKAKEIIEKAPDPVKANLRNGTISIDGAFKEIKQQEKQEKKREVAAQIEAEPPPLPDGPFRVLVADPPWLYAGRAEDPTHRAANPYPSMPIEAIRALPVADLAHEDCILWLWTTNAHMREAFTVLDAWGFTAKTILTWVKDRMGTGDWLRGQTEHCLMAVRGRPTVLLTNQTTVIHGPLREHSRKPDEFYQLVEKLCPGSKAELFARQPREGWGQHGGEIEKFP